MADLSLRLRITADGSELKAELVGSKEALTILGAAATAAGAKLDAGLKQGETAASDLAGTLDIVSTAVTKEAAAVDAGAAAADRLAAETAAARTEIRELAQQATVTGNAVASSWSGISAAVALQATEIENIRASWRNLTAGVSQHASEVDGLRTKYVPLYAAEAQHKAALDEISRALKIGAISEAEAAAAVTKSGVAFEAATQALNRHNRAMSGYAATGKLTGRELGQLSFQLNDVAVSLAGGMNPLLVLLQQGSQITPIFGGARNTLKALGEQVTVARVGFGALAGSVITAGLAFYSYIASTKQVEVAAAGVGRASGATVEQLRRIADEASDAGEISVAAARDIEVALLHTGKIGVGQFEGLIGIAKDFAATIGADVETATGQLAELFADPARGAQTLSQTLGLVDGATARYVQRLVDQNNRTEAQKVLLDALRPRLVDATEATTALGRAWDFVARMASNAMGAIGSAVDRAISGPSDDDRIAELRTAIARLREGAPEISADTPPEVRRLIEADRRNRPGSVPGSASADARIVEMERELRDLESRVEVRDAAAAEQAALGAARAAGDAALGVAGRSPATSDMLRQQRLGDQLTALKTGVGAPGQTAAEQAQIAAAIDATSRAITTYIPAAEKAQQLSQIDIQLLSARSPAERARLAGERERISLSGEEVTAGEAAARVEQARARALAEGTVAIGRESAALSANVTSLYAVADAYLTSASAGEAAAAQREAVQASLTSGVDAEARARELLAQQVAQTAVEGARQVTDLRDQAAAHRGVTEAVAAGTMTQAEAQKQLQLEQALRPLLVAEANAEGAAKKELTRIIQLLRDAYGEANDAAAGFSAASALQAQRESLGLAQYELSLAGETAERRAYLVALRQKELELQRQYGDNWRVQAGEELRLYDETLRTNAALRQRTEISDALTGAVRKAGEAIQESLGDTFRDVLDGNVDSFEDFGDRLLDIMKDVAAQIAALLVFQPIVGGVANAFLGQGTASQLGLTTGGGVPMPSINGGAGGGFDYLGAGQQVLGLADSLSGGAGSSIFAGITDSLGITGVGGLMSTPLFGTGVASVGSGFAVGGGAAAGGALAGGLTSGAGGFAIGGGAASSGAVAGGLSASGGAAAGGVTLGGTIIPGIGILAAGYGIGQLLSGIAPGNKLVSMGGGAVGGAAAGAAIGSVVPVIGTAIGAIIGAIAGLIGGMDNDKPSNKTANVVYDDFYKDPRTFHQNGKKFSQANLDAATGAGAAVRDASLAAFGKYVDFSDLQLKFEIGSREGSYSQLWQDGKDLGQIRGETSTDGVKSIIGRTIIKISELYADKLPEEVTKALSKVDFSGDIDEALRLLVFAADFKDAVDALRGGVGIEDDMRKGIRDSLTAQIDALKKFQDDAEELDLGGATAAVREYALVLVGLKDAKTDITQTEAAMKALDETFKVLRERASDLGLTQTEVAAGYAASMQKIRDSFDDGLDRAINQGAGFGIFDQVTDLLKAQEIRQKEAATLGLDMSKVARLAALEVAAAVRQATDAQLAGIAEIVNASENLGAQLGLSLGLVSRAIDEQISTSMDAATAARRSAAAYRDALGSINDAIAALKTGDLSTLSPAEILAQRRQELTQTATKAKGGDLDAMKNLPAAVQAFLEDSRAYNASAPAYQSDFDWASKLLQQAGVSAGGLAGSADTQADLLDAQTRVLEAIRENLTAPEGPNAALLREQLSALDVIGNLIERTNTLSVGQATSATGKLGDAIRAVRDVRSEIAGGIDVNRARGITGALNAAQTALVGNNTAAATSLRGTIAALQDVTRTGLVAVARADTVRDALGRATIGITGNNSDEARALKGVIDALSVATADGLVSVSEAAPLKAAIQASSQLLAGNDTAEGLATRKVLAALSAITDSGLSSTAKAAAVTAALQAAEQGISGRTTAGATGIREVIQALRAITATGLSETAAGGPIRERLHEVQEALADLLGDQVVATNATTGQVVKIRDLTDAQVKALLDGLDLSDALGNAIEDQTGEIITGNATTDILARLAQEQGAVSEQIKQVIAGAMPPRPAWSPRSSPAARRSRRCWRNTSSWTPTSRPSWMPTRPERRMKPLSLPPAPPMTPR
ncbi:hypothetical protein D3874_03015 [Oleomonas cavernae]|uniref:Bacteriophage tail tape measure N-terminal domain-containing protein n=1 Tax=Oleomonas cavernae TaxID=2320859 RepID=A0A418WU86_9PROT|nr:phage tail length tape measure family protein [Oleomonas cavernae]RJF94801.1 hypothetical protein D3874_03015 [Oleomonas cavernae]